MAFCARRRTAARTQAVFLPVHLRPRAAQFPGKVSGLGAATRHRRAMRESKWKRISNDIIGSGTCANVQQFPKCPSGGTLGPSAPIWGPEGPSWHTGTFLVPYKGTWASGPSWASLRAQGYSRRALTELTYVDCTCAHVGKLYRTDTNGRGF